MNRYGEKLSPVEVSDPECDNDRDRYEQVMFGGCGVRFGAFQRPVARPIKRPKFNLLAFLGLKRKRSEEYK